MSDWMIFAERLSEQMKKQNLSIRQLAERMDMTSTTIFRYAKGQRVPRATEILKASDALGVTCDYLLGLSDDPKKVSRPSARPEIIRCKDCIYYDPPHVENNGERIEYSKIPEDAFDVLGTGLVYAEYGINIGGRCLRDYNVGYSEDKRFFVSETNYCGRAERRTDEKIKKYRKKPIVIEAYQTDASFDIETLEGIMRANVGDYIITGVNGEQYPCKPDIFKKTYEEISDE